MVFQSCILFFSMLNQVNPNVTMAVITVESRGNPNAIGSIGEIGLMQIRPEYVPESTKELFDPCTNIRRGVQLLKIARDSCRHKLDFTWVICYNLGVKGGSRIEYPKLFPYYKKVSYYLNK